MLFEWVGEANRRLDAGDDRWAWARWPTCCGVLGLENLLDPDTGDAPDADAERMLAEREQARAERDFARADELRDQLAAAGWVVRDTPEGARLVRG